MNLDLQCRPVGFVGNRERIVEQVREAFRQRRTEQQYPPDLGRVGIGYVDRSDELDRGLVIGGQGTAVRRWSGECR